MDDSTASMIFNLMYIFFWFVVLRKMRKRLGHD